MTVKSSPPVLKRESREAAALRDNLRKRKQQAQTRAAQTDATHDRKDN